MSLPKQALALRDLLPSRVSPKTLCQAMDPIAIGSAQIINKDGPTQHTKPYF
jgi:hypothetical protein